MGTREEILKMAEDLKEKAKALSKETKIFREEMEEEVRRREELARICTTYHLWFANY